MSKTNVQILKLKKNESLSGELINDTLYLPLQFSNSLDSWMAHALEKSTLPANFQAMHQPFLLETEHVSKKIAHQEISSAFHSVYEKYAGISHFVIENNQNIMACFDLKNKEFYRNPELGLIAEGSFSIVPADINSIINFKKYFQCKELSSGIWQFVWDHMPNEVPEYTHAYRLLHWPQPASLTCRSELFKMSAFLSKGCTAQFIHQKTNIRADTIHRYLFACEVAQIVAEIPVTDALDVRALPAEVNEVSSVRGFFSSLRKKLGL
ncbi:hypothetical protein [Acinetobacter sp. ANC 4177]|uniref:hypothetical protein n=1 Tax=Acinetobacter sp. ANC 4177 TaxID=2529838 RepID=UPI0020773455|nr:hypothetical protein [Acinetobacter sp. ANC 4177]